MSSFHAPGPIHHIGIVTDDLDAAVASYRALGFEAGETTRVESQNVDIVPIRAGESWIEILAPLDHDSGIGRYLASRGTGIHHVAYLVDDLAGTLDALDERGVELIDKTPRVGFHDWLVAFVHPRACGGVLTELVQRSSVE
ncbi:MAG: methylmalonyl-CoA epimerase [Thermomicrobiales bacterium]